MNNSLSIRIQQLLQFDISEEELLNKLNEIVVDEKLKQKHFNNSQSIVDLFVQHKNRFISSEMNPNLIRTGFQNIDKLIDGFLPGEYILIGARPCNGLGLFLLQLVCNISKEFPVLYVSMHNSSLNLTARIVSVLTKINSYKLLKNEITQKDKELLSSFEKEYSGLQLLINKASGNSIAELRMLCEDHVARNATKVIFFDELQMISPGFRTKNRRELEDNFINNELKRIARDLNVCIIVGSHLNKSFENRIDLEGNIPLLFENGSVEHEADKVFILHRLDRYGITKDEFGNSTVGIISILLLKSETGERADFYMKFNETTTAIVEISYIFPYEYYFENEKFSEKINLL